ncbi:hypothetical protein P8C59_001158 [Phyllachora maydis]|uniref:Uncharacterized protein n=1 Tax=Phyllachora maydis TaxID=1825666 RepID=A0AAD9HXM3_9PEZI|nr:hypothetical protein P8C59_001158 [Phyllachora maydis]
MASRVRNPGRRFAQMVKLKPEYVEQYKSCHAKVWPEVLKQIKECNIVDYSIFHDETTGILVATFKYVGYDYAGDMDRMRENPKVSTASTSMQLSNRSDSPTAISHNGSRHPTASTPTNSWCVEIHTRLQPDLNFLSSLLLAVPSRGAPSGPIRAPNCSPPYLRGALEAHRGRRRIPATPARVANMAHGANDTGGDTPPPEPPRGWRRAVFGRRIAPWGDHAWYDDANGPARWSMGVLNDKKTVEVPVIITSHWPASEKKKTEDGRFILDPQPEDSANDPLNWPAWRRDAALLSLGLFCMVGGGMTPVLAAGFTDVAHDYARIFQGVSVSPVECLPSATIAEIFFLHERAYRIGIYTLLLLGGKNLVPLVSAAIIQRLRWRWVFWIVAITYRACQFWS